MTAVQPREHFPLPGREPVPHNSSVSEEQIMLHLDDIVTLEKKLRDNKVLSVYVNGSLSNPAERNAWRTVLEKCVSDARERMLRASPGDSREFEAAVQRLHETLPDDSDVHTSKGWAGFFSTNEEAVTLRLPTSVPNVVSWDHGIRVSPIFRAVKQLTPVIVLLADGRSAQFFRYVEGHLDELETIEVETVIGPVYHMGDAPRGGFHVGVRGSTGTDEAERVTRAALERMYRVIDERLGKLAGNDGWLLLGGTSEVCSDIENTLPPRLRERTLTNDSLHRRSRSAEVVDAARAAASELRARKGARTIDTLTELAGARGKGTVGVVPTLDALKAHAVQTLLFTSRLMETYPDLAESLVRLALHQGAEIEQVNGAAAQKLDEEFDGVAARLRFVRENEKAVS